MLYSHDFSRRWRYSIPYNKLSMPQIILNWLNFDSKFFLFYILYNNIMCYNTTCNLWLINLCNKNINRVNPTERSKQNLMDARAPKTRNPWRGFITPLSRFLIERYVVIKHNKKWPMGLSRCRKRMVVYSNIWQG